jgi:hypothetical protein
LLPGKQDIFLKTPFPTGNKFLHFSVKHLIFLIAVT